MIPYKYRKENEEMFIEMLSEYIQLGKINEAKKYLEMVKGSFGKYDEWKKILDVHQDLKELIPGRKLTKIVFEN